MIGKAVWGWICSAAKRPFIQRSFDELVALVNSADAGDIETLNRIQEELDYRKRLKGPKREGLRALIETKIRLIQAIPGKTADCYCEELTAEKDECQQETDQSIELEEKSKGNRENLIENHYDESDPEESNEYKLRREAVEDINKCMDLESLKTFASQLPGNAQESIATDRKVQSRHICQSDLSRKTYNALRRNGFEDISRLQCMSDEEILMLKGIGQKALDEIRKASPLRENTDNHRSEKEYNPVVSQKKMEADQPHDQDIEVEVKNEDNCTDSYKTELALERQEIDLRDLTTIEAYTTHKEALECLNEVLDAVKKELCMVTAIKSEREFIFLLKRMSGMSLEAIGQEAGISRERVRQIIKKTSEKLGFQIGELCSMLEKKRSKTDETRLKQALDRDLEDHQMISKLTIDEWNRIYGREMSLRDRIDMLRAFNIPIPGNELQDHLTIIEQGKGQYGGAQYWDDIEILRLLMNKVALNNGKPGIMPRQIEIPRLVSRYIQRRGGQRQVAHMLGMSYEGPIGSRNRNYWNDSRILKAIRDTQDYFGLPEDLMPEQSQVTVWLDVDEDDDTKGPSCIAAIKKEGGWKHYCNKKGYRLYIDQDDDGKKEIDSRILLSLWNRNNFITKESEFLDVFTEFLGEFWNSPSDPRRYISLVNNACKVAKSIAEHSGDIKTEQRKEIVCRAVDMPSTSDGLQLGRDNSDTSDVDRFVELLF